MLESRIKTRNNMGCVRNLSLLLYVYLAHCNEIKYSTFDLKTDVTSAPVPRSEYTDIVSYIYTTSKPVYERKGKILAVTQPDHGQILTPKTNNGFVDTFLRAYNEHRNLVLSPDDIWIAITTALGLYVNANSEDMRHIFVEHEGKKELKVKTGGGLYNANWDDLINRMSQQIEDNTKGDMRSWIEPNFSTTTTTTRTVGQVVLMGVMQSYFEYKFYFACGIPRVTLLGTLSDWQQLRMKAKDIKKMNVTELTRWAELLDPILEQFIHSYSGNVDIDFWSHIWNKEAWGSGPPDRMMTGWINVFLPFTDKGDSNLMYADPEKFNWGRIDIDLVPPSTTEVPVYINDNGREYDTIFYGGHIASLYDVSDNSVRPSLDWAIIDITDSKAPSKNKTATDTTSQNTYKWQDFPEPSMVRSAVLTYSDKGEIDGVFKGTSIGNKGVCNVQSIYIFVIFCVLCLICV